MNVSHGSVHPVDDVPTTDGAAGPNPPRVRMKDLPGMPGTPAGLTLRLSQFLFSSAALAVMASTSDFPSVTAFCYLVAATGLQTLWSFSLAIADVYALLVGRSLQSHKVVCLFTLGDGMTSTLTFAAACASAGITVLIDNDLDSCAHNHCAQFETATAMAFITWFTALPSFLMNFWSLASRCVGLEGFRAGLCTLSALSALGGNGSSNELAGDADIFNKFKVGNDQKFTETLQSDASGLLSLYEATHLRVAGEDILEEALAFTTTHLESIKHSLSPSLSKQVTHSLNQPLRKGITKMEARYYLYHECDSHNENLLTFAKLDFNLLQQFHQKEPCEISRWWKDLDVRNELPFRRDRVTEVYFCWALSIYFEPEYAFARTLCKVTALTSILDDIYDLHGTLEELELFTEAIEREKYLGYDDDQQLQVPKLGKARARFHFTDICSLKCQGCHSLWKCLPLLEGSCFLIDLGRIPRTMILLWLKNLNFGRTNNC